MFCTIVSNLQYDGALYEITPLAGGAVIVNVQESSSDGQVPEGATVLRITYVPGILAARFINPVVEFIDNPGVEL